MAAAKKRNRPEQAIQAALAEYLQLLENQGRLWFYHVPNGGVRSPVEAAIMKGLGVKPGVYDLCLMFPDGKAAYIELKAEGGRTSVAQDEFGALCWAWGFQSFVVDSVDEGIEIIKSLVDEHAPLR